MTHLQKITTLAKKIRKQHPNKKWTDCVKAASKNLKAGKKVAGYTGTRRDGNKTTVSYTTKKVAAKKPAKATQAKLFGAGEKHMDTKSHNINVKIGNIKPKPTIVALSKKIKLDTEYNNHTEAVLKLAKFLKDKEAIETLNFIKKTSDKLGYMNSDLYGIRNSIYNLLMKKAKLKLNGIDYQEIHKSF